MAVSKGVASTDLKPVVVILSGLGEREFPTQAGQVGEIVDKTVNAALPDVFHFQINVGGEFAFEGKAFVQDARRLQRTQIGGKGRENRSADRKPVLVEELIEASAGTGSGDEKDRGRVVEDSESGGEFGVAAAVKDPGSGEAGREEQSTDELIPVIAKSGFDKDTLSEEPAILSVSAEFGVVLGECGGTWEDRVA